MGSAITWTNETWETVFGCSDASEGCDHCYARGVNIRIAGNATAGGVPALAAGTVEHDPDGGLAWTGLVKTTLEPRLLNRPMSWRDPRLVFVNSRADTFHPNVPTEHIEAMWEVMRACPQHVFQVLTKRPGRMRAISDLHPWFGQWHTPTGETRCLPNVWVGTSIESNRWVHRADAVRGTLAAVRWISAEPLLEPLPDLDLSGIDWLVVGGESKAGARPMDLGWARDLRDRCRESGTAFFFKQTGEVTARRVGLVDTKGEDITEAGFPEDLRIREYPAAYHQPTARLEGTP